MGWKLVYKVLNFSHDCGVEKKKKNLLKDINMKKTPCSILFYLGID